jgi:hypothetical protein
VVKVKLKLSLSLSLSLSLFLTDHHAMKAYWEIGGIAPRTPDLDTRWR